MTAPTFQWFTYWKFLMLLLVQMQLWIYQQHHTAYCTFTASNLHHYLQHMCMQQLGQIGMSKLLEMTTVHLVTVEDERNLAYAFIILLHKSSN